MTDKPVWRVLPWRTDDPYTCMAIDKTIAESVAAGGSPTIRFYRWAGNGAVSYGRSQDIADIATDYCREQGIPSVRRFTEARAMYHGPMDLTYALAAPVSFYRTRVDIGIVTSSRIISFLDHIGIRNATQAGYTSVMVQGKKISGSVPYFEQKKALFQHGGVFCALDYENIARIYGISEEKLRETTTSIEEENGRTERIEDIFQACFLDHEYWELGELTVEEQKRIREWSDFFATEEWLLGGNKSRGACSLHHGPQIPMVVKDFLARIR